MTGTEGDEAGRLLALIGASWAAPVIHVAAVLGLADLLADGPATSDDLAGRADADPPSLHRLLRALVSLGLCDELDDGRFAITPLGAVLRSGDASLRSWAMWWGGHLWEEWGGLLGAVRTGRSAREALRGADDFGHLDADPEAAALFNDALASLTRMDAPALVAALELDGVARVADVGGGNGELLRAVLLAHPDVSGMLVDLDHALPAARARFEATGLADRCSFVAADFFDEVPGGADAYILKSVLHDWDDDQVVQILTVCRGALGPGGRLLLAERIVPPRLDRSPLSQSVARMDLNMLVAQGGRERTEAEFRRLLREAGLFVRAVRPASATLSVIDTAATSADPAS